MSNYKTHTFFNIFFAFPLLIGSGVYFFNPSFKHVLTFAACFIYATLFMNPDLDMAYQIKLRSLRGILSIPFRSYARLFSHRGISHYPILGTLTRILWLGLWGLILFILIYHVLPSKKSFAQFFYQYKPFIYYGFAGIVIADLCHLFLDIKWIK